MNLQSRTTNGNARSARNIVSRLAALCVVSLGMAASLAMSAEFDRMDLERWKKLRETERYQLNIAEKYYNDKEWKIAAAEYEKFLTLYEQSEGAGFSQLKWAICQVNLRQSNTAIKEGFQSVIDYWPDTPDAIIAAYKIGETYKAMGEIKKAKKAFLTVVDEHPDHLVAACALRELIDITTIEQDPERRVALQKKLTFDFKRARGEINDICASASRELARYYFYTGAVPDAVKALATTYDEPNLPPQIIEYGSGAIAHLVGDEKSREKGFRVADACMAYIREKTPSDITKPENRSLAMRNWYYLAAIQTKAGRHEEVPKIYEQMIAKFGVDDALLANFAKWYKDQNNYDKARETYARYADKLEGQKQIAYSHRQQRNTDLAVDMYRRLAAQYADHAIPLTEQVAAALLEVGRYKDCVPVYMELMSLDSARENEWRYSIGEAYRHAGEYKEAIAHFRLCGGTTNSLLRLADCHHALKEWSETILMYNQAMGTAPNRTPEFMTYIARTLEAAGQPEKAIRTYQQICDKYASTSFASDAHTHLKSKYKITSTMGGDTAEK